MFFTGKLCLVSALEKRLIAQFAERHGRQGNASVFKARGIGTDTCTCFEIRTQGVTHAGYQEFCRCICNDFAVHDDGFRIFWIENVFVKGAVVVIDDRKACAGGVCRCYGRYDRDRALFKIRSCFCSIYGRTAADADNDLNFLAADNFLHFFDFTVGADSAENLKMKFAVRTFETLLDFFFTGFVSAVAADKQE